MSDPRSVKLWEHWRESSEKLDYFVLGISAALTAYLGQNLTVRSLGFDPATAELVSLMCLALSVLAGLDRLRSAVANLAAQTALLEEQERTGALETVLKKGGGRTVIDEVSGATCSVELAQARVNKGEAAIASLTGQVFKWRRRSERAYNWRDWLLAVGVILFAVAKVWAAGLAT